MTGLLIAAAEESGRTPLVIQIAIVVLAGFLGFQLISKVPNTLHTPLMSGTNAIHGIVLLGAVLVISSAAGAFNKVILFIAIVFGTFEMTSKPTNAASTRIVIDVRMSNGSP